METKELKITPPEGYEVDKENSTFGCIKFKPIEPKRWRDDKSQKIKGYFINNKSNICSIKSILGVGDTVINTSNNYSIFATEKQAKSALAMARISQIMANDERFGGVVTDEEWNIVTDGKYIIDRNSNRIVSDIYYGSYSFLAFHTEEQRNLFLEENEDLVRDYFMVD